MRTVSCCRGAYHRTSDGVWCYPWGARVPGALDLILREGRSASRTPPGAELDPAVVLRGIDAPVAVVVAGGAHELVVGILAPELLDGAMLSVGDIAELAGTSKARVDSACFSGELAAPQRVVDGTRWWARPFVVRWIEAVDPSRASTLPLRRSRVG